MSDPSEESGVRDAGYDDFLDAVEDGDPYYLESPSENGWLPPTRVDPETGETNLAEKPLPRSGEIQTYTRMNVVPPEFDEDAPYVVAIADFGPVSITGQVRIEDPDRLDIGMSVELDVDRTQTTGERVLVFEPV